MAQVSQTKHQPEKNPAKKPELLTLTLRICAAEDNERERERESLSGAPTRVLFLSSFCLFEASSGNYTWLHQEM